MSRVRKRIADEDATGAADLDESMWAEEDAGVDSKAKSKSRSKSEVNIEDVLHDDDDEDEEEEDDASEGEDEEDDDAGSDEGGGGPPDDGFDEEFIGDESDQKYLDGLTEIEREGIIVERREAREKAVERYEATQQLKAAKKAASQQKGKGAKKSKKSTRASKKSKPEKKKKDAKRSAQDAMQDLLARKMKTIKTKASDVKAAQQEEDEEDGEEEEDEDDEEDDAGGRSSRKRQKSRSRKSQRDEDGYDEEEDVKDVADGDGAEEDDSEPKTRTRVELANIKGVQLRRVGLEKIIDEPYFKDVVVDMFVRVNVGTRLDGTPAYRMCQVVGVEEWKSKYKFGNPPRDVKVALLLRYGKAERLWSCMLISNASLTQEEFDKWRTQCETDQVQEPTAEEVLKAKRRAAHVRSTFQYSPQVLAKMIEERRNAGKTINSRSANLTAEKARLLFEFNRARDGHNEELKEKLQKQLDECDEAEKKLQQQTEGKKSTALVHGILQINQRNIAENTTKMEDMMKMLREEKKREAEEARKHQALTGQAAAPIARDAFKRKETRPTMEFIADAETVAEANKQALAKEKQRKEEEAKARELAEKQRLALANRNRLEHFEEDLAMADRDHQPEEDEHKHDGRRMEGSNVRTLRLPHQPSVSDKLVHLLQHAHRAVDPLVLIDPNARTPSTSLVSVLGRFVEAAGGPSGAMSDDPILAQYTQPPTNGGRVLTFDEYKRAAMHR